MQPVVGVADLVVAIMVAVRADALGHLVLMVREQQVDAAAVDVDGQAQALLDHGRALNVPAGPARPPGAVPDRLVFLGRLPQHEVGGMLLVGGHVHPRAGDHVLHGMTAELAVVRIGLGVEQHMALSGIGRAIVHQPADHGDDRVHGLGRPRLVRGAQGAQLRHVGVVDPQIAVGDRRDRHAFLGGLLVDLVVHVRDVGRIDHVLSPIEVAQQAEQHVEHHHRAGVADMGVIVDRRPTDIHRHPARIAGDEGPLGAVHGVVEGEGHRLFDCLFRKTT